VLATWQLNFFAENIWYMLSSIKVIYF